MSGLVLVPRNLGGHVQEMSWRGFCSESSIVWGTAPKVTGVKIIFCQNQVWQTLGRYLDCLRNNPVPVFQISCYQRDVDGSKGWCAVCKENAKEGQPGYCSEDALPVRMSIFCSLFRQLLIVWRGWLQLGWPWRCQSHWSLGILWQEMSHVYRRCRGNCLTGS